MRKYRGLTKEGKWVYGWYAEAEGRYLIIQADKAELMLDSYDPCRVYDISDAIEVIPETVGKQVGLKAAKSYRDDLEIYEGDIIKYPNEIYKMFRAVGWEGKLTGFELIVWCQKNVGFLGKDLNRLKEGYKLEDICPRYLWVLDMTKSSEIIGDIHTTPELMEQENE